MASDWGGGGGILVPIRQAIVGLTGRGLYSRPSYKFQLGFTRIKRTNDLKINPGFVRMAFKRLWIGFSITIEPLCVARMPDGLKWTGARDFT